MWSDTLAEDVDTKTLRSNIERCLILLGQTNVDINYYRRRAVLSRFFNDAKKATELVKDNEDLFLEEEEKLFGSAFYRALANKAKNKKQLGEARRELVRPGRGRNPFSARGQSRPYYTSRQAPRATYTPMAARGNPFHAGPPSRGRGGGRGAGPKGKRYVPFTPKCQSFASTGRSEVPKNSGRSRRGEISRPLPKLETDNIRCMGPSDNPGVPHRLSGTPQQNETPIWPTFSKSQEKCLKQEIQKLLEKRAIEKTFPSPDQFLSFLFLREKKDGSQRPIINFKPFNKWVVYNHFKMENFHLILDMTQKGEYFVKIDLKDAYLTVPIAQKHRKYLRFQWENQLYQFRVCPFGLASAPHMFTKLLKPVTATLRKMGVKMIIYLDDMIFLNTDPVLLHQQTQSAIWLLEHLGFQINREKSITTPTQQIEFLGFQINSQNMIIKLPQEKRDNIMKTCTEMLNQQKPTIRELASLIGKLEAAVRAITPGPLHFRRLQMTKTQALLQNGMNYGARVRLTPECTTEIRTWMADLDSWNGNSFIKPCADMTLTITSDASDLAWGATCGNQTTQGTWSDTEKLEHINVRETKAAFFAIKAFTKNQTHKHIHIKLDNTTAVATINKKGSTKSLPLLQVTNDIWQHCRSNTITITAEYLPGHLNQRADYQSRVLLDNSNWKLNTNIFTMLNLKLGPLKIDLFADRMNTQLSRYISWRPDPEAENTDAFAIQWMKTGNYLFPPFCLISKCLAKIQQEKTEAVIVTPAWYAQPWYATLLQMTIESPILLPQMKDLILGPKFTH
jgi:hypothetical protein